MNPQSPPPQPLTMQELADVFAIAERNGDDWRDAFRIVSEAADFVVATRKLVFAARTTGGVAGRDDGLCAALDVVEKFFEASSAQAGVERGGAAESVDTITGSDATSQPGRDAAPSSSPPDMGLEATKVAPSFEWMFPTDYAWPRGVRPSISFTVAGGVNIMDPREDAPLLKITGHNGTDAMSWVYAVSYGLNRRPPSPVTQGEEHPLVRRWEDVCLHGAYISTADKLVAVQTAGNSMATEIERLQGEVWAVKAGSRASTEDYIARGKKLEAAEQRAQAATAELEGMREQLNTAHSACREMITDMYAAGLIGSQLRDEVLAKIPEPTPPQHTKMGDG